MRKMTAPDNLVVVGIVVLCVVRVKLSARNTKLIYKGILNYTSFCYWLLLRTHRLGKIRVTLRSICQHDWPTLSGWLKRFNRAAFIKLANNIFRSLV